MIKALLVSLGLISVSCLAQTEIDSIEVTKSKNTKIDFCFGQIIGFDLVVNNKSSTQRNYHKHLNSVILKFQDSGQNVVKKIPRFRNYNLGNRELIKPESIDTIPGKFKQTVSAIFNYDDWGNIDLKTLIKIPDSLLSKYSFEPRFLRPGQYTVTSKIPLYPSEKSLVYDFKFTILPPDSLKEYREFIRNINDLVKSQPHFSTTNINAVENLLQMLRENPRSPYSLSIFFIITGSDWIPDDYHMSNRTIKELFDIMPKITPFYSSNVAKIFLLSHIKRVSEFKKEGLITDERTFLDSYLREIKDLNPAISEFLISQAKHRLNIDGLVNYSE
jgi:hypothetical protein